MQSKKANSIYFEVAPDVWGIKDLIVNVFIVRNPANNQWVVIDTGLRTSRRKIKKMAADLFGPNSRPEAIILTHGHFDHVGSLETLAKEWNVPVYAHLLEFPYLNGKSSYPPPDPSVGGGLMASLSWMYPKKPVNVSNHLQPLPNDGSVPFLPDWKTIETPGHSPGHVSFFREKDKLLIAGDAVVTTKQESLWSVLLQKKILSGPPKYFTCNWEAAKHSVKRIADLKPRQIATGHGRPFDNPNLAEELQQLVQNFDEWAVPKQGRYVTTPAMTDSNGVISIPPKDYGSFLPTAALLLSMLIAFLIFYFFF